MDEQSCDIEKQSKLNEMIIFNFDSIKITMKDLYDQLKIKEKEIFNDKEALPKYTKESPYELEVGKMIVNIYDVEYNTFNFKLANLIKNNIFFPPINAIIQQNNKEIDIDIISYSQILNILEMKQLKQINISCENCKETFLLNFFVLTTHIKHKLLFYDPFDLQEFKGLEDLNNFFPKTNNILKFESALSFEKNFNVYFNKKKYIDSSKQFEYYYDIIERQNLSLALKYETFGKFMIFFGNSGIGKSITIVHTLKYQLDHDKLGTLYIHCKYLAYLQKEMNYIEIKRILVNEIPYLYYKDFANYEKCVKEIKQFELGLKNTIWDLIDKILNDLLIVQNKKCFIVFDQYSKDLDPNNKMELLVKKILGDKNGQKLFSFFCFMSMNNKEVKELKRKKIFNIKEARNIDINEIKNTIIHLQFEKKEKQEIFEKLGKTLRNYHEISQIKNDNKKLKEYYINKKKIIQNKIIAFYMKEKDKCLSLAGISDLIKFSVGIEYTMDEIKKLFEYINFKYFDITINNEIYSIIYLYPIVEDVLKEIYYDFLYGNQNVYDKLLCYDLIKGGGKGCCFEQIVVAYLSPNPFEKNFGIPDIEISIKYTIPKFLPNDGEVNIPYIEKKIKLENNKTYLIEQEIFGGKAIDFIIIDLQGNEQIIFAFQVRILKDEIFDNDDLKEILHKMINYLENFITNLKVKDNNLYFGYIFSLVNEKNQKFGSMINKCKNKKIGYSFFSTKNINKLLNEEKQELYSVYEMVKNPFSSGKNIEITINQKILERRMPLHIGQEPKYSLNKDKKDKIIKFFKDKYRRSIQGFEFRGSLLKKYILGMSCDFYYTENNSGNSFVIIKGIGNLNIYNLDEIENINEEHVFNINSIYDCYNTKYKGKQQKKDSKSFDDEFKNWSVNLKRLKDKK